VPIPSQVRPTPALCSVCTHFAWKVLEEKWDGVFAPILANESILHSTAFSVYLIASETRVGRHAAFEFFRTVLTTSRKKFWNNSDFDAAMFEAFKGYWNIAIVDEYWLPNRTKQKNGWFDFDLTIKIWQTREKSTIVDWQADLDTWRNDN
jgi:hypothetical protein